MLIDFCKYQGAGNDFVMLDNMSGAYDSLSTNDIALLCDRRFGIGADGLLLLSRDESHPFRMVYYNQDGSRASFCGNGARCICSFAVRQGIVMPDTTFSFIADDGPHSAIAYPDKNWVDLLMSPVKTVQRVGERAFLLNTGVPHYVEFVDNLEAIDIMAKAPEIRFSQRFAPDGVNVNFVNVISNSHVAIRTYERGVEAETLACGTGITAAAIATAVSTNTSGPFNVSARGGELQVRFNANPDSSFCDIHLCGPALLTFAGRTDSLA